jgi:UPF0271 protein
LPRLKRGQDVSVSLPSSENSFFIIDASALLSGMELPLEGRLATTQSAVEEVRKGKAGVKLDYLLETRLDVLQPSKGSIEEIVGLGKELGDLISKTDAELLALAKENNAVLLTDDYSMQNIASLLKMKWKGMLQKGISNEIEWGFRCTGCKKRYKEKTDCCPICGAALRRSPIKITTCQSASSEAGRS